jgi:peptide/nickel transport system substrate-binding protein
MWSNTRHSRHNEGYYAQEGAMLRNRVRGQSALALLVAGAMLLAGCSVGERPAPAPQASNDRVGCFGAEQGNNQASSGRGGGMTVASIADAVSLHPFKTSDTASGEYQALVYGGSLLERNPEDISQFRGAFAESWTVGDDKVTYTFRLKPDLVWSDGQPITSADFKWTFEQANNPANAYPYITNLEEIVSYEAPDPRTLVIRLAEPVAIGLEQVDQITPLPKHVWETLDWNDPSRNPEINKPTVGSGPFMLQEWNRDVGATFVPNDRYFKGKPKLDRYSYRIAGNPQIAFEWLVSGEVDAFTPSPEDYDRAKRQSNLMVCEWWPATGNWSYIGFNLRQPKVQDVRVRQALAHAIDRQALIERVMYGLAQPTYSAYGPTCWCYNPDVPKRDYDLAKARALLDEAGWRPGADGIRTKDGQRLQLNLLYGPNSNKVREKIATIAQASFKDIGVQVDVVGLEWAAYLSALRTPPFTNWDLTVAGWQATIDPHWMYQIWSADNIPELNSGAYNNPEVETLFKKGAREFDPAVRKQIYGDIQRILTEDQPYIYLYQTKSFEVVNNRIGGIKPSPLGLGWNLEEWYVR